MVGTYSHGNRPSSARYSLENVFMRGTPPRCSAISRALQHARVGDGHAGELEREIGLDGGVHFRRAAVINVPAAVGQLHREDVIDRLALPFLVHLAVPMVIRHRVRDERGIHHQFADPVAFRLLQAEQISLRPQNGGFQIPGKIRWQTGCRRRLRRLNP